MGREAGEADYCGPHGRTRKAPAIRGLSRGQPLEVPVQTITPGQALGACVCGGAMLGVCDGAGGHSINSAIID